MPSSPEQGTNGRFFRCPESAPMPDGRGRASRVLGILALQKNSTLELPLTRDHELHCDAVSHSPPSPPVRPRTCSRPQHHVSRRFDWPVDAVKGGAYPGSSWICDPQGCRSHFALPYLAVIEKKHHREHPRPGRRHGGTSDSTYIPRAPLVPGCRSLESQQHHNETQSR